MQQQGKVILVGSIERGVATRTGNAWASQEIVIETQERFPIKQCWRIFGEEKISAAAIREGELVTMVGYPESHEYNGSWYTELRVTDVLDGNMSRFVRGRII